MKRTKPPIGAWCPVSGRVKTLELAWQAALREIREETGLNDGVLFTTGTVDSFYDPAEDRIRTLPVFLFMIEQENAVTLDDSQSEYVWLDVDAALAQLTFAGHCAALTNIRRDFLLRTPHPLQCITP